MPQHKESGAAFSASAHTPNAISLVDPAGQKRFRFGRSNLTTGARQILANIAGSIRARAAGTVTATGYTDAIGPDSVNYTLSRARAAAVVGALRPRTPGITYVLAGRGPQDPVVPNRRPDGSDNPVGCALNRRSAAGTRTRGCRR